MTKMLLQVHDELVFEVPNNEVEDMKAFVEHEMVNAIKLNVPVKVHLASGDNWAQAKA